MSKEAIDHHRKAAEHHEHAAKHHLAAAEQHEAGNHEKAGHTPTSLTGTTPMPRIMPKKPASITPTITHNRYRTRGSLKP